MGKFAKWFGGVSSVALIGAAGLLYWENSPEYIAPVEQTDTSPEQIKIHVTEEISASFEPTTLYNQISSVQTVTTENGLVSVEPRLQYIFAVCSQASGIPAAVLANKAFAESSLRANAFHPDTNARGLFQFLPNTALEILYDMGRNEQYAEIFPETQLVTRRLDENDKFVFGVVAGVDERALIANILYDPLKSTCMAAEYNKKYLSIFAQDYPDSEMTSLHSYLVHWQGKNGAEDLMKAFLENPDQSAVNVVRGGATGQIVQNHLTIFYNDESPRSVSEMFDYLSDNRGIGNIPISLEAYEADINIEYSGLDVDGLKAAWPIGPVYVSLRPQARPTDLQSLEPQGSSPLAVETSLRPKPRPNSIVLANN